MMGHLGHAAHREHVGVQELSRDAALARAKDAAKQHGYDLEAYRLSTFGADRSADGKEWLFMWECLPENHPPGCSFLAVVNRSKEELTTFLRTNDKKYKDLWSRINALEKKGTSARQRR